MINKVLLVILLVVAGKIVYMTTFRHSYYTNMANQKTYKQIMVQAPRGEIRDRNGVLLAGNEPQFTVQVVADSFNKVGKENQKEANKIAYSILNILERKNEKYTDEFPITIENGKFSYTFDKNIKAFKDDNAIPQNYNVKQSFYHFVDYLIKNEVLSLTDRKLEPVDLQSKLNSLGYYPPILVSNWTFTQEKDKEDWLDSYNKLDKNTSAQNAFKAIREYYEIDPSMSDKEARKIMIVRDMLKSKVYTQYNPVTLARGIKSDTVA